MRLILVIEFVAEGLLALVEDHRQMRRPLRLVQLARQLPQHRHIAIDRASRLTMFVGELGQHMIGAEDEARAVDEIEMGHGAGITHAAGRTNSFS